MASAFKKKRFGLPGNGDSLISSVKSITSGKISSTPTPSAEPTRLATDSSSSLPPQENTPGNGVYAGVPGADAPSAARSAPLGPRDLPTPPEDGDSETPRSRFLGGGKAFLPQAMNDVSSSKKPASDAEKSDNKIRMPQALRKIANLDNIEIEGSLLGGDLRITDSEKQAKKEGLCSSCSKIDFEQFALDAIPPVQNANKPHISYKLIFLDRILRKKRKASCRFCELLFDAIAENDPFEHPAVKNHLPAELAGMSFAQWADSLNRMQIPLSKTAYPFGRSRDNIDMQHKVDKDGVVRMEDSTREDELTTSDMTNMGGIGVTAGLGIGMLTETDQQRLKIMATIGTVIPTITSLVANLDSKLPVAVSIMLHNAGDADAGLINVDVWGYGNAHRAPLSRISTFNLRVAAGYTRVGPSLHYGNVLRGQIDVEGDCRLWLDTCTCHHGVSCDRPNWAAQLPPPRGPDFRLIDVNAMRVITVDQTNPPRYAALSYVWGVAGRYALKLSAHNADALARTLEGHERPVAKTIHNAIEVTRRLGVPYLWADSLCIMQKDEYAGEDNAAAASRRSQIAQMDSVYGHAHVTLVAADGADAEAGLAGVSPGSRGDPLSVKQIATVVVPGVSVLAAMKYPQDYGRWDTRAWTLQEKLLSKRLLIFSGGRVSFHCRHGVLREDMPESHAGNGPPRVPWLELPESDNTGAYTPRLRKEWDGSPVVLRAGFFGEYAALVGQYSARRMTDSRDALNAVFGLLKVLERMAGGTDMTSGNEGAGLSTGLGHTLYGLPERFLDLGLMWQPPAAEGVYLTKKTDELVPSWSWAGWEVGTDAAVEAKATKPGVRFEEPFWVATNDDLSLRKVVGIASEDDGSRGGFSIRKVLAQVQGKVAQLAGKPRAEAAEERPLDERYRPMVMWFRSTQSPSSSGSSTQRAGNPGATHSLIPVNGHGLGMAFDAAADRDVIDAFIQAAIKLRGGAAPPKIPMDVPLDNRHLVCETQVASFRLRLATPRREKLWKRTGNNSLVVDSELVISEAHIVDPSGRVVGTVTPTDSRKGLSSEPYHLILLSEAQYWGDEERVDGPAWPLYNVMVVEYDTRGEFASRIAVGKVRKTAWWEARPSTRVVLLK